MSTGQRLRMTTVHTQQATKYMMSVMAVQQARSKNEVSFPLRMSLMPSYQHYHPIVCVIYWTIHIATMVLLTMAWHTYHAIGCHAYCHLFTTRVCGWYMLAIIVVV